MVFFTKCALPTNKPVNTQSKRNKIIQILEMHTIYGVGLKERIRGNWKGIRQEFG